ncbi:long-chain-fatty-acid--CoA ligase ACSBG2-like [Paramacrobiotus metropolitanus]|uniref:long-chain-fatty-acid--CoA ligase ACSBG2-like n=1 Tax=Paramacrobiotus metropolitanus TaxID=2943436 RepID=UPI002445D0B8|nr:long-chain-fatty-acid--CoA ligase ACSBG2-like [Paramacrobiotus metropolitanus]
MTIVDPSETGTVSYQKSIPGNASPKMELYGNGSLASSPSDPLCNGFHYSVDAKYTSPPNGLRGVSPIDGHCGPDQCAPADNIWSIQPGTPVKIRMGSHPHTDGVQPESVPTWFTRIATNNAARPALKVKRDGAWKTWTYQQYHNDVVAAAKAFIHLGLEPFHAVGIIGFNAPEWFISDMAAIYAGGLAVGIYTTNSAEACLWNASDSRANIIVCDDDKQVQKIMKIRHELPHLKAIIQYLGTPAHGPEEGVYSWAELLDLAKYVPDVAIMERHAAIAPNKCCTVIYTSGTTGNPKGAMLSHDNLLWTSRMAMTEAFTTLKSRRDIQETFVSYLPLSHVAAQMTDLYLSINTAGVVWFAQPDALKGTLVDTLREARPTALVGVPRVFEKMAEKMQAVSKKNGAVKTWIGSVAQDVGLRGNLKRFNGRSNGNGNGNPLGWTLANAMVFKKVRQALGLDRCIFTCSGAAPMMKETLEYFLSFNIPIYDIYGMSESSAPHTLNLPGAFKIGSAGRELIGVVTKIDKPDAGGNGEICMYGRHIFMGYLGNEEKTREVLDAQGYLHTGDIGRKDSEGFLFITGRLKELLITAGGENVPPIPIEDAIKEELPIVSNAMVIGDKRKFLAVLLTLKSEIDLTTGAPLDRLTKPAQEWIKENVGQDVSTVTEAVGLTSLQKIIEKRMALVNKRATSRAQCVQKFKLLPEDFSIPGGELGPTLKLKRNVVAAKYSDLIEQFYDDTDS